MDTKETKTKLNTDAFDSKIRNIERVINSNDIKEGRIDLFDKYSKLEFQQEIKTVFLSYSHKDKVLAGKIAAFLRGHEVPVFLAHEDIEISKEWREEILRNLNNCNILIALLTPNFKDSVWTNQEAGFGLGRNIIIVPLIVGETNIKEFGFLETIQGIQLKETDIKLAFKEIQNIIGK